MKKSCISFAFLLSILLLVVPARSQELPIENSLLWKISGNNLREPSYLFGTFHLLGGEYVDSLQGVMNAFSISQTFAGEVIFDSTMPMKMMNIAMMQDTTLQELINANDYQILQDWFHELMGVDLHAFNRLSPVLIQMMMISLLQQEIYGPTASTMDIHFQTLSKNQKKIVGLESFEDQADILFRKTSYREHARQLVKFVNERQTAREDLIRMNKLYQDQNLTELMESMVDFSFSTQREILLDDRNKKWMELLTLLFTEQSTFVAVGALHLPGQSGLVNLLRKKGYSVVPIPLNE